MQHIARKLIAQPRAESCEKHGHYESRNLCGPVWSKCPACAQENAAEENAAEETQKRLARRDDWQERIGGAGIPERFRDRSLRAYIAETPEQQRALAFAIDYADGFDSVLKTGKSAIFIGMGMTYEQRKGALKVEAMGWQQRLASPSMEVLQ